VGWRRTYRPSRGPPVGSTGSPGGLVCRASAGLSSRRLGCLSIVWSSSNMDQPATALDQFGRLRHWCEGPACTEHRSFAEGI